MMGEKLHNPHQVQGFGTGKGRLPGVPRSPEKRGSVRFETLYQTAWKRYEENFSFTQNMKKTR